jgi:hypothetical protein
MPTSAVVASPASPSAGRCEPPSQRGVAGAALQPRQRRRPSHDGRAREACQQILVGHGGAAAVRDRVRLAGLVDRLLRLS